MDLFRSGMKMKRAEMTVEHEKFKMQSNITSSLLILAMGILSFFLITTLFFSYLSHKVIEDITTQIEKIESHEQKNLVK